MSTTKFWILNFAGGLCALLIGINLLLQRQNENATRALGEQQAVINRAQQIQKTAQNLIVRIAQAAQKDAVLRELMTRQDLKVNFTGENQAKP
jgi:hypothetical protein